MASAQEITESLVALNATVQQLTSQIANANGVIQAQAVRIQTLEGAQGAQGHDGERKPFKRMIDTKVLSPAPFTAKDEHRWREWSEEFEDYIESVDPHLAGLMRNAPDEENPIDNGNLELTERQTLTDVRALLTKMLKHPEAKARQKSVPDKNVLEVWRILGRWFDPQTVGSAAASLSNILNPKRAAN